MNLNKNPNKRKRQDQLYKLLRKDLKHHDFQYITTGPNILTTPFDSSTNQGAGALYACYLEDIIYWLDLHEDLTLVYEVTLLEDSQLVECDRKVKTDKLLLSNPKPIGDFLHIHDLELSAVLRNNINLKYIKDDYQTDVMCMAAINSKISNFQYIKNKKRELCLYALSKNYQAIQYFTDITFEYFDLATQEDTTLFECIKNPTLEMCISIIKKSNVHTSCTIIKKILSHFDTPEIRLLAITNNPINLQYIKDPSQELCIKAVTLCGLMISKIPEKYQTQELWENAVKQNTTALHDNLKYIYIRNNMHSFTSTSDYQASQKIIEAYCKTIDEDRTRFNIINIIKLLEIAIEKNGFYIQYMPAKYVTRDLCLKALNSSCISSIKYIQNQTEEYCELAIHKDGDNLEFIKDQTSKLCKQAILKDIYSIRHIKKFTRELFLFAVNHDLKASSYVNKIIN
jgi:hypothetical protein